MFMLLVVAACLQPQPTPVDVAAPPTPGFSLAAPTFVHPGQTLTVTATLPPGAPATPVRWMIGRGGVGPGPCLPAGTPCLDVQGPVVSLPATAPVAGVATLSVTVPAGAPGGVVGVQAIQSTPGGWTFSAPVSLQVDRCGDGALDLGESCLTDSLLAALRADPAGARQQISDALGWPAPVERGLLFVADPGAPWALAGDHSGWAPQPMRADLGFRWRVEPVATSGGYKFTQNGDWIADGWSRAYAYDAFGEMSLVLPSAPHLERLFGVTDGVVAPRTIRAWIPSGPASHVLYAQDGQNLFDPGAIWGGWHLQDSAPAGMMIVGVDNTPARMDEYTHVQDNINGQWMGGDADVYGEFVHNTVRARVAATWGEPAKVGLLGSSLGGLVSLAIADQHPGAYDFVGTMSGTLGWGSIAAANQTMIQRYAAAGHRDTVLYVDSGGSGLCWDGDGDGTEDDDPNGADNYCENRQFADTMAAVGYAWGVDLHHWWEPNAQHNEAEWGARVWRPMGIFGAL